ncbi:BAR-domain-containing protein [Tilletiaria anomala UBC 951]|uniref:BAR-domain-containing protein n=1 Tax=Tilletiaria anomala (strain ATCC 24038 / CBS 436.72 / UBC 951) TaxID=1037660 RepID=A0A066WQQ7_TILAU|nr:BAR-domain-containing protein [Tilletiaria anomala UBC 951]KDN53329.1 BAR-domain-containing protein [Tilletiaria anomala UBC 951]
MKGIAKAMARTPHLLTSKVGMTTKSSDAAFDELNRKFTTVEKSGERLQKDAQSYKQSVQNMLLSGAAFGSAFANLFSPSGSEADFIGNHPQAATTIQSLPAYDIMMEELREALTPEIDLIENRIIAPIKDFNAVIKSIRKNITKRDHKLIDYDRHNNAFSKVKDKKEKSLKDEQNLFKLEQGYETAAADYEYFNNAFKEELPNFFELVASFMTPLFHSLYYMQLNVFYLTLEKFQTFASGRYDLTVDPRTIEDTYAQRLADTAEQLEALCIRRPAQSSARILGANRSGSIGSTSCAPGGLAANAPSRAGGSGAPNAAASKPPPPPPPAGKKPGLQPQKQYVIALYDYTAQVSHEKHALSR